MMTTWQKALHASLVQQFGKKKGNDLHQKYAHAFSLGYTDEYNLQVALADITQLEKITATNPLGIHLYNDPQKKLPLHVRIFKWDSPIPLADILPLLENLDLRAYNENSDVIQLTKTESIWISDFSLTYTRKQIDIKEVSTLFETAFADIYNGKVENDGLNKLVLAASLSSREITVLRAYTKYLRQIKFHLSQAFIEKTFVSHPDIAKELIHLFMVRFQLSKKNNDSQLNIKKTASIEANILKSLENVLSLDEDQTIRRFLDLIKATLRTNYFQLDEQGHPKTYLSLKLNAQAIPGMPLPVPLYEIFVYSPRFEAIHLRHEKVARGGIRWSGRLEDFRTEILGLMKAQKVKNAIIVPSGAKGGFVLKSLPLQASSEIIKSEVIACYQEFISGLLDITDNIKEKKIIPPKQTICYDEDDPYLVVAADKGTATFSDTANALSLKYDFWLGDAFASGGKTGYDHKKMAITARGAWESIKRHFRECNIDIHHHPITVMGIGDMSGDVFGNGMLYTKNIKLIAAFDHRHIFLDPHPDPERAYIERQRLFHLPSSSWEDYNPKLISKGGGVFKRNIKSITLSPQIKKILVTEANVITPDELIRIILKAPLDLLFNGGIGTYIKSRNESDTDVGDRANDNCRINGDELRCKVVGEGGNLGFTQLGRIEYAMKGGLINTDFIDNSGGVDCSDHEVNLKILLDREIREKRLTEKNRNKLLASLTQEVAQLVLHDNYNQALVMSFSAFHAKKNIALYTHYIGELEKQQLIDREVEGLPDEKILLERKAAQEGLTRPELAVLLAYTKINLKHDILKSTLPEDAYLSLILETAFPASIRKKYKHAMLTHALHRNIIATQLSNHIVNEMGMTFVYRLQTETGATIEEIIRAYTIASRIFQTAELRKVIETLDFKVPMIEQYEMLFNIRNLINLATRWFLHSHYLKEDLKKTITHFASRINILEKHIPDLMTGATKEYAKTLIEKFISSGLSQLMAQKIATYRAIYTSLNIIDVATKNSFDLIKTAHVYFIIGERANLVWFRDQLSNDAKDGHWNILARLTLRDELDISQRQLTISIINHDKNEADVMNLIQKWANHNQRLIDRWHRILEMLHASNNLEYSMFFIAIRELIGLILNSDSAPHILS